MREHLPNRAVSKSEMLTAYAYVLFQPLLELNADTIVKRVRDAYAHCGSYSDTGSSTTVYQGEDGLVTHSEARFRTTFSRPGNLNFVFEERSGPFQRLSRYVLSAKNKVDSSTLTAMTIDEDGSIERNVPISLAVAGLTGVTASASRKVPRMLLPRWISGQDLLDSDDLTFSGLSSLNGSPSLILESKSKGARYWIDAERYLVLQTIEKATVTQKESSANLQFTHTIRYNPRIRPHARS